MRFTLDEKQQAIADLAGGVLDGTGADAPDRAWKALGEAGLLALAVPSRLGGDGLGMVEVAVLLAEIGRRAIPVPALATLALGVLPVARWGSPALQDEVLSDVASGSVLTAAVRSRASCDGTVVSGTAIGVPYAEEAHRMLVPVDLAGGGTAVAVVDPRAASLTRTPAAGAEPEYTVRLCDTPVSGLLDIAADIDRYAVAGTCALGEGALAGALALTAAHVGTREQFGRPLAAFQAVAQQIADVYVAARTVRLATLAACWGLDSTVSPVSTVSTASTVDKGTDLDVAAYWFATEAPAAVRTCHHLHGGLGLDITYPLHRYSSLIRDLVRSLGGVEYRVERLGSAVCSST
jgi:alkylation response protein AidB-like acyl-CoA dehydrogenase